MFYKRRKIMIIILTCIIALMPMNNTKAANIIYEDSEVQNISSGVTHEKITRFTENGWININVLRADLSNPYLSVDAMTDSDSVINLNRVSGFASSNGAVAAINGGFFNWLKGTGKAYPDGPLIQSGELLSASSEFNKYNNSMATFSLNSLNQIFFDYWKTDIKLYSPNGTALDIGEYNKPISDYNAYAILTKHWGKTSIGKTDKYPNIMEMVVVDDTVTEIRSALPATEMPDNGYVLASRSEGNNAVLNNFKVGDKVSLSIKTTPDLDEMKVAISGSAILVKNGEIPETFSLNISGRQPRTSVGSTKDGKQLILVTVDGRQNSSIGMTQEEMAALMIELGAYNALNLDGGGSTTMVTRKLGTNNLELVNSPSDGMERKIADALGLFSLAPKGTLNSLLIDTEDKNIFLNTSREFTIKGYDKNYNPVGVDLSGVTWKVNGLAGSFKDNVFYPKSIGSGKILATVGNVTAELPITVLSYPRELYLNYKDIDMPLNTSKTFTAKGKTQDGYSAIVNPQDIKWSAVGDIGTFKNNIFTSAKEGVGYVEAALGGTRAYCKVSTGADVVTSTETFEKSNGSFLPYPAEVKGGYQITAEQKHSGASAGKLSYDFSYLEGTRAAYLQFGEKGISLDSKTNKIGVWVYNSEENTNWLRAMVLDSDGNRHSIDLADKLNWTGWKYVQGSLEGIESPASLARIYLVQIHPVPEIGSIYIDDIQFITSNHSNNEIEVPADTVYVDSANKKVDFQASDNSLIFSVFGQSRDAKDLLEKLMLDKFIENSKNVLNTFAIIGGSPINDSQKPETPSISTEKGYNSYDINNNKFIQLDMSSGGLRTTDAGQWSWFNNQLTDTKADNIFIFMSASPKSFNDSLEAELFQNTLTKIRKETGKTIWIFYKGSKNESYMEEGIKYITTAGFEISGLSPENTDIAKYIEVIVNGTEVTYQFRTLY